MERTEQIRLVEFDCPDQPLPKHTPAVPRQRGGTHGIWRRLLLCFVCLAVGGSSGWVLSGIMGERAIDRTIAMSWGDSKYGKEFYGAQVYLVPVGSEYSVHARVFISPGGGYYHDFEEIGRAKTVKEAVERWGKITWWPEGLDIGDPAAGGIHYPRHRLESHR
jgi:hypothetical protein